MRKMRNILRKIIGEIKENKLQYYILFTLLALAFFIRVYRADSLLGFYYDQGRDALVIWDLIHKGKMFLIGPTTGLAGVFLGPFYYYLITPFYLLGRGDPAYPAVFLAFLSVVALGVLYYIGAQFYNKKAGLFALIILSISYNIVYLSRWLSNPTPIFLSSVLLLLAFCKLASGASKKWWLAVAFFIGISLHFEAASAFFYFFVAFVFFIWQVRKNKKNIPSFKIILLSAGILFLTQSPQLIFNYRHDNIWLDGLRGALLNKGNVSCNLWKSLVGRSSFFWNSFSNKVFPVTDSFAAVTFLVLLGFFIFRFKKLLGNDLIKTLTIFIGIPLIGYTLFQGNLGYLFDYYLMGYYLPFILLISIILYELSQVKYVKYFVIIFFVLFIFENTIRTKNYITTGLDGPASVVLGNQIQIADWVYKDSGGKVFNIDVYVPPVIPYAYDYLFLWQGKIRCGSSLCGQVKDKNVDLLYTIYEADFPHPERLEAWLIRQAGIGKVEYEYKSGGITVQRRSRI